MCVPHPFLVAGTTYCSMFLLKRKGISCKFLFSEYCILLFRADRNLHFSNSFSQQEIDFICKFATEHVYSLGKTEIPISDMHNIVEGALEKVNPAVAKSYRDYRNYKTDFIHMMDEVYTKSQSIRYIGDKSNAIPDRTLFLLCRSHTR